MTGVFPEYAIRLAVGRSEACRIEGFQRVLQQVRHRLPETRLSFIPTPHL